MADQPDDGEADDVAEDGSWICPNACGAGGRCVKGDEAMAEMIHLATGCPNA